MRQIAVGRIIGLFIAMICISVSIWCGRDARRMNDEFHQWLVDRPMETAIDLSQTGHTVAAFHQTCGVSHGEALCIAFDLDSKSGFPEEDVFKGLSGNIVIRDSEGSEIESAPFNSSTVNEWDGKIMLTGFAPFRKGAYVITIQVDSGAAALAGKKRFFRHFRGKLGMA